MNLKRLAAEARALFSGPTLKRLRAFLKERGYQKKHDHALRDEIQEQDRLARIRANQRARWARKGYKAPRGTLEDRRVSRVQWMVRRLVNFYTLAVRGGVTISVTDDPAEVGVTQTEDYKYNVYGGQYKRSQYTTVTVPRRWYSRVYKEGLDRVDGLATLDAQKVESVDCDLYAATWLEQGRGTSLRATSGYIARADGVHYHAASLTSAIRGLARKVEAARYASLDVPDLEEEIMRHAEAEVLLADARAIGACEFGIRSWCNRVDLSEDLERTRSTLGRMFEAYRKEPIREARATILKALKRARRARA